MNASSDIELNVNSANGTAIGREDNKNGSHTDSNNATIGNNISDMGDGINNNEWICSAQENDQSNKKDFKEVNEGNSSQNIGGSHTNAKRQLSMSEADGDNKNELKKPKYNKSAQTEYTKKYLLKKRQRFIESNKKLPTRNLSLRYASEDTNHMGDVNTQIKGFYSTFRNKENAFPRESNRVVHVAMGMLFAALSNPNMYKPLHEGRWTDLDPTQKDDNRVQLQDYFVEQLKLEVSGDYSEKNGLICRLCRTMAILKLAGRQKFFVQFDQLRDRFMTVESAMAHVESQTTCTIKHCALCNGSITEKSFHTKNILWKDGGRILYRSLSHLEDATNNDHSGVLPISINAAVGVPASIEAEKPNLKNARAVNTDDIDHDQATITNVLHTNFSAGIPTESMDASLDLQAAVNQAEFLNCPIPVTATRLDIKEDSCWYVGPSVEDEANGATVFDRLSLCQKNTLTKEECMFVEKELPNALMCKGSVTFFRCLKEALIRGLKIPFLEEGKKSATSIQGNCIELYADAHSSNTACVQQFLKQFCPRYQEKGLDILRKYTEAQFLRDPRSSSGEYKLNEHSFIISLPGAPAQNMHIDNDIHLQGSLTLTPGAKPTKLYYGMKEICNFNELIAVWESLDIYRKFNFQLPGAILKENLDSVVQSVIASSGTTFHPRTVLEKYEVQLGTKDHEFMNHPGTQIIMSAKFVHAGPGLPRQQDDVELQEYSPTDEEIKNVLSPKKTWESSDMEPSAIGSLRAQMFFSTYIQESDKYDPDEQLYGFNGTVIIASRLWAIANDEERQGFKWLIADYIFASPCDVQQFVHKNLNTELQAFSTAIEHRRKAWLASPERTVSWHDDIWTLLTMWRHGCNVKLNIFHDMLSAKLQSMNILSLLTAQGQEAATKLRCLWVDNRKLPSMLKMFDSMVQTSNKGKGSKDYTIQGTSMSYSKGASSTNGGISTIVTNALFRKANNKDKQSYIDLGKYLEEQIEETIRTKRNINDNINVETIICNLLRTNDTTSLQKWHYDYGPQTTETLRKHPPAIASKRSHYDNIADRNKDGTAAMVMNSFSCITPLTLGGCYIDVYNPDTKKAFLLHIPRGFTFIFDDNTIHAGGYLFDPETSDKRLHHYFVFKGGPRLSDNDGIYLYMKGLNKQGDPKEAMCDTIEKQFQEHDLRNKGWFTFC